jgi:hypothetical protein
MLSSAALAAAIAYFEAVGKKSAGSTYTVARTRELAKRFDDFYKANLPYVTPVEILLWCPSCGARHIDEGEFATKPHHTHACQSCGMVWRPAIGPTCGVQFLPGFKNEVK